MIKALKGVGEFLKCTAINVNKIFELYVTRGK